MPTFRRAAVASIAIGLLAGCSSTAPTSLMPASGSNPTQPVAQQTSLARSSGDARTSGDAHTRRVLYIADIDGKPGVGQIHVYPADMKNVQEIRTITNGTGRPFGLWVDAHNILYVANLANLYPSSITEFKPGASSPFFTITNFMGYPQSVAVDAQQNVYVNESVQDHGFVQVYAPGKGNAERTIDTGVAGYAFTPGSMAFDPQGNLLVAEQAKLKLHIVKIVPGAISAVPVNLDLTNITGPGMGIDKTGNIYVASQGGDVAVFAAGQTEPFRTISPVSGYGLTWVTPQGAVYQASGASTVTEIAPGSNSPTNTVTCTCSAQGAAVSR
jgi:sugar lactone lactonase YvrE